MGRVNDAPEPVLPAGLTTAVGGPAGRRLRRPDAGPLAPLAPAVLLLAVPLSVAALRQAGCLTDGWRGGTPLWRQCASPLVESVPAAGLGRGLTAYLSGDVRLDEPVLEGAVTSTLAGLSPGAGTAEQRWFLVLWMLLASVLLVALVLVVGTVRRHPAANAVVVALSPVLALTVLLSADLVPILLAVTAVWAWSRDRPRLAGALVGLAFLGGAVAAVVLLVLALLPGPGGAPAVRRLLVTAGVTVVGLAVSVSLLEVDTLTRPYAAWLTAGAGPGSPWYLATLAGHPADARLVVAGAALGWVGGGGPRGGPRPAAAPPRRRPPWWSSAWRSCWSPVPRCRRSPPSGCCRSSPCWAWAGVTTSCGPQRRPSTRSHSSPTSRRRPTRGGVCRPGGTRSPCPCASSRWAGSPAARGLAAGDRGPGRER